jgi:hypothetical protein
MTPITRKLSVGITLFLALILVATSCSLGGSTGSETRERGGSEETTAGPGTTTQRASSSPTGASEALGNLRVAQPGSMSGYSRESFKHWSDAQENGWDAPSKSCDARDAALIRDGEDVKVENKSCKISSGQWPDPYTKKTLSDPKSVDIDHIVPLAEAWRSGASAWNDSQRERYANDPEVLLSVEATANRAKGDKDPAAWKPPNEDEWCDYATRWIEIKSKYSLSVDEDEKTALQEMLNTCA